MAELALILQAVQVAVGPAAAATGSLFIISD
jgi:hypothetical protein